jgi:hypothetical protein
MNHFDSVVSDEAKPMTYAVQLRIRMIDFLFAQYGWMHREAIMDYFGVSIAQASLDIKTYMNIAPQNIVYNLNAKRYEATQNFTRVYP